MTTNDDPRCPECGEPIGQTATYCMHCSADLTGEQAAADTDDDGTWDQAETESSTVDAGTSVDAGSAPESGSPGATQVGESGTSQGSSTGGDGQLLDPDGFVDDALTVVVGIAGGIVVGLVGTVVLGAVTASPWAIPFGLLAWLVATAYLVRTRTVQGAVSKSAYSVAAVLLFVPVIALSPVADIEGGLEARGGLFVGLLVFVAIPAVVAAAVGWIASLFVPEDASGSAG